MALSYDENGKLLKFHVVPWPKGWSIEQAWEYVRREEEMPVKTTGSVETNKDVHGWVVVESDWDGNFIRMVQD